MSKTKKEKVGEIYDLIKERPFAGICYLTGHGFFRIIFNLGTLIIILSIITATICEQAKKLDNKNSKENTKIAASNIKTEVSE